MCGPRQVCLIVAVDSFGGRGVPASAIQPDMMGLGNMGHVMGHGQREAAV